MTRLVVGSRASKLALTQTELVIDQLLKYHPILEIKIREIVTEGDQRLDASLPAIGGKGVFIKEIEHALLNHEIDFAVHSLKDMPTEITPGLKFAAILEREDARDVLISASGERLLELPEGAAIGTGSPRRACQLSALRPDLEIKDIRGNVDTRLRKLEEGQYDAILLAAAGLHRLGLSGRITEYINSELMLPAVGQGALALQTRREDTATERVLSKLNHVSSALETGAERSFLAAIGGGCAAPISAFAQLDGEEIFLVGFAALPDGSVLIRDQLRGPIDQAERLGRELAADLLAKGASEIIQSIRYEA